MNTPILHDFCNAWITLFSQSSRSRLLWRTQTGLSALSYSSTWWWSQFEVVLIQPLPAAAERVFSILQRFTVHRQSSLEDYIERSVLCSARQQTTLGLGPPLAGQSRSFGPSSRIVFVASVFELIYCAFSSLSTDQL